MIARTFYALLIFLALAFSATALADETDLVIFELDENPFRSAHEAASVRTVEGKYGSAVGSVGEDGARPTGGAGRADGIVIFGSCPRATSASSRSTSIDIETGPPSGTNVAGPLGANVGATW